MPNPIKTTSRTYNSVISDIDSFPELKTKPRWFKRFVAGAVDVLSRMQDAISNLSFLRTSFTRPQTADLLEQIDYNLAPQETSFGTQRFNINPDASFPKSLPKEALKAITGAAITQASFQFESRVDKIFSPLPDTWSAIVATDILNVSEIYDTGDLVRLTTTGTLPAPLVTGKDFYAIFVSDTEIRLAETLEKAYLNQFVVLTSPGTGSPHGIDSYALKTTAFQQTSLFDFQVIGQGNAVDQFQRFQIPATRVLRDTLLIRINSVFWDRVTTLVRSVSTDTDYRLLYNTDTTSFIKTGGSPDNSNDQFGARPGDFPIDAFWAAGGGLDSNIFGLNRVNIYTGGDSDVVNTSNVTDMEGGKDEESIESGKEIGPLLLAANSQFVGVDSGIALTLAFGGVTRVHINRNEFGVFSAQVLIVPTGGGLPSTQLKDDLQAFLISRSVMDSMDVRVEDPIFILVEPDTEIEIQVGFNFADVVPFYELSWILFFSEITEEIITAARDDVGGIDNAISFINAKFGTTFVSQDGPQVRQLIDALDPVINVNTIGPRKFDEVIVQNNFISYALTNVNGLQDVPVINAPTFPLNDDALTSRFKTYTIGTITTIEAP